MIKRIGALLLVVVVISIFAGFSHVSAEVAAGENVVPVPEDTARPIPASWPEEPGAMPDLIGGKTPNRPLVFSKPAPNKVDEPAAPAIDVWLGKTQKFGQIGNPQQWVNVLGNVTGIDKNDTLTYKLNSGADLPLSIGGNGARLEAAGDFNVEIDYKDLNPGNNSIVIKASDGISATQETVTVNYTAGQTWPGDYEAVWNSSPNIQDTAQVVDGNWQLDGNNAYIDSDTWGYDRLLAIGDETWTDYEVTVPVTVYGLDPSGYGGVSNGPAVGFIMRWLGHNNMAGEQPNADWQRTGAIGWYRWSPDLTEALELRGYDWRKGSDFRKVLEFNTAYIFKMSVQSVPGDTAYYRLKFWKANQTEPNDWDLQGFSSETASAAGSLLLVAHHVDAKFGEVTVKDLSSLRLDVDVTVEGEGDIIFNPDQEDFAYSERVRVAAIPAFGYDFGGWSGDYSGMTNPADFRIYRDMNITAKFTPKPPTNLKVNIEGQGSVIKNPDKSQYLWGESVSLTAQPAGNQIFLQWTGDATGIQNPVSLIMDEDKEVTAVFGPKSQASPRSDDFSGCILNTNLWTAINPAGDADFDVTGRAARFRLPAGSAHNMWNDNADALRIMQPTKDLNFEVEAKFVTVPEEKFQMEGILIQQDDDNWLRFDFYHNGSTLLANAAKNIGGNASNVKFSAIDPGSSTNLYVRVERNGNKWTQSYSFNGSDWTTFVVFIQELEVKSSGVFAGNAAQTAGSEPAFESRLDYYFNNAVPIFPEDEGNTIVVDTVGQGQVQVTPVKDTYQCGEKVTLSATPAPEWLFAGWSGDLSGGSNPATVIITGDYEITARFSQGATVFLPTIISKN